jgi:hypothetical protein
MKKTLLFLFIMLTGFFTLKAQLNLYTTDFESYTVGTRLAVQAGAPWTTWSNAPGGTEDPFVSSTQAHSGTKSVNVLNANDCVFQLNDKTTGRYLIEWYMYVESGKLGYFNFLSDFAAGNSKWALQAFIINDSIFVDANGASTAIGIFTSNNWKKMQVIVDVDDDFATLYIDGLEITSYQWSKGAQGTDNSLKLDGINFYGWDNDATGTSGYYIDDLKVDSIAAPDSPTNLTATLNGADIDVVWTAPSAPTELYKLSRNGVIINSGTGLTYTDVGPWPNTYIYGVRARYAGIGYSHSSNTDTATITGGVTRNIVLMEGGTYLTCSFCPGAAMGLRDLIDVNHKNAVAIEYHNGDAFDIPASLYRTGNYYGITGYPTMIADGKIKAVGGSATVSLYPTYLQMYNERVDFAGHQSIDVSIVETSANNYTATISINQTFAAFSSNLKLYAALTESNIPQVWGNQTECDFVCRGMYPDHFGTTLNFGTQNPQTVVLNFSTTGYVKNNCEFVVFVQHDGTHEVSQAAKVDMSSVIGVEELSGEKINIYPNPTTEYIIAMTSGKGTIEIFDMTGKLVSSSIITKTTQVVDVRNLRKGIYMVKVTNDKNTFTQKLLVE